MSVRLLGVGKKFAPTKVIDWPTAIVDSWTASKRGAAGAAGAEPSQPIAAVASQVAAATQLSRVRFVDCFHMSCLRGGQGHPSEGLGVICAVVFRAQ